ncbi:MAG: hypothetical protein JSR58_06195 [Verrucomicrobia bacterium]|nr:hypothetical protein [Verrucomicrobiota bacterium]
MASFPTVRIVSPPPAEEWTWGDYLGVSERYRKECLDLALKQLLLMLTIDKAHDDRMWDGAKSIIWSLSLQDRFGGGLDYHPGDGEDFKYIYAEIRGHLLSAVSESKPENVSYIQLFEEKYFTPLRKHQENVQAWQACRAEAIWQRFFVLAPLVHLVGWIFRQILGIAAKERAIAHSKDPHYRYGGSDNYPLSLQNRTYRILDRYLEGTTSQALLAK